MQDLHKRWSHRWLSPKAEVKNSPIHGLGVFAKSSIKAGEEVGVLGGIIVSKSEIQEYWKIMGHVGIQFNNNFFIVPTSREELKEKGVFNHSCEPNLGFGDSITLVAIKDIEPDQELVFDYAFNETYHNSFQCNCESEGCRGTIKPDDWQKPEIKEKYKDFYSPYLKNK